MSCNSCVAKRYIRSISDTLSCSGKIKRRIVSQICDSVDDYLQQNPDADFEMIQAHFGTPQEIAVSYVNEQDAFVLLKKMSVKKKILALVAGVMVAIFLMWIGLVTWETINSEEMTRAHLESFITE